MDPFTQRMLQKAEQRSRALGISTGKYPLSESGGGGAAGDAASNAGAGFVAMASQKQQQQPPQKKTKPPQQQQQSAQQLPRRSPAHSTHASTNTGGSSRMQVVETTPLESASGSSDKVLRQFSAVDKENMDVGIEINIMTDKNIEVQVQVEEQDMSDDDEGASACAQRSQIAIQQQQQHTHESPLNQPLAAIRDTSRNRLQRLGALYSNNDLSSPIHRTEAQFHAGSADDDGLDASLKKPKQRYGKLAALANTINQWEDDSSANGHQQPQSSSAAVPPPKPDLPSRGRSTETAAKKAKAPAPPAPAPPQQQQASAAQAAEKDKTKQLKWDPKVMNSLEAQGFQRRESSTTKLAYDYAREEEKQQAAEEEERQQEKPPQAPANNKPAVGKLVVTTFGVAAQEERKTEKKPAPPAIKSGLVSGRMAAFESKASGSQQAQRQQKDPTELSMKERMLLFEKNKGDALMPKAAFGMAPSIAKIRQDSAKKDEPKVPLPASSSSHSVAGGLGAATAKPVKVHDKVAALVANVATISENKIKADINRQRQEDMQILANRFNKQKEIFAMEQQQKETEVKPPVKQQQQQQQQSQVKATAAALTTMRAPPPPPPLPTTRVVSALTSAINVANSKRHSPGDASSINDEKKRARKSNEAAAVLTNRLYPVLSDLQSNDSFSDNDNCGGTTATASGCSSMEQHKAGRDERDAAAAADDSESYMEEDDDDDDDDEEDDSSVGICNGSLGREIMQVVQKNEQKPKQTKGVRYSDKNYYYEGSGAACDSSQNSSEASMGIDDYLDEALDERVADGDDDYTHSEDDNDAGNVSCASRNSKGTTASNSFSFRKSPQKYVNCQTISEEADDYKHGSNVTAESNATSGYCSALVDKRVKSELSVNQEDDDMVTLVHTVSFYRRQQSANSASSTPVRLVRHEKKVPRSSLTGNSARASLKFESPQQLQETTDDDDASGSESGGSDCDNPQMVQEKIKRLLDEVCKQQQIIAQTSQALNLCAATVEFSGSTEAVEGERHLLVATHRRQACLDEVQRLRIENRLRPKSAPKDRGMLTAQEITIPLRQDYIRKLAADTISGHHLVCLLKCNEHVLATKTVPTLPGLLAVKFPDVLRLNNVYADFRATLEIYGMTAQREVLPHEVKYHINLNKKGGLKTPKKKNAADNRLVMPPVQSPAGPHVVRTPALVQYGFAIFSLREIQRTTWTLTQVLGVSPLDGVVHMKAHCELTVYVEHKGFLTMFEDISGFGAWHRRWCYLNGTILNYWKYPDDERKKAPLGSIDLCSCSTQKVAIAPRHICARLNTLLLESERPALETDQESLIIVPNGRTTIVRYLLSADTKEERDEWSHNINKTITLLRAWGPMEA